MNKFLQSNNNNIATYHWNITFKRPFEEDGGQPPYRTAKNDDDTAYL